MLSKRNVYLKMRTLAEAREIVRRQFAVQGILSAEDVAVPDAVGRILAHPVTARISSPNFHAAAMDGVAVKAEHTFGASAARPKQLVPGREAFYVNTGHVLPPQTDAVIMIEHVRVLDDTRIEIETPIFPWQNVRKIGEDIVATELLFPQNHLVTPYCIGALLNGGVFSVAVKAKPKVLIIPTGRELVDWHDLDLTDLKPGQVLETNSFVLGKLVEGCGGAYERHDPLGDDPDTIQHAVRRAISGAYQLVLIIGGSSAGSEDFARNAIEQLGDVLVHGVTIMPGKPVVIGKVAHKPVIGIPGYPVSAIIAFEQLVRPLICALLGQPEPERETIAVEPTRKIASKLGLEEFLRVKLGQVGPRVVATPLPRGAGSITSLTEADGIVRIPNRVEGIREGEMVTAELLRPLSSIRRTLVVVGSHDNSLDILANQLKATSSRVTLSSSHVGSLGGLMAIKRGVCHLAGSHLLDTQDGTYNISYIKRYLPETPVALVNLVLRDQGLIVRRGNPRGIRSIEDLGREDVSFVNRQAGSGTRILLDYRLKQIGLDAARINGYQHDEYTHMSVAVAVLSGTVDVGLGIYAAARALGLDFIPIVTEQYDLVIPAEHLESEMIQLLLEIINSPAFKQQVASLGGYHLDKTGEMMVINSRLAENENETS